MKLPFGRPSKSLQYRVMWLDKRGVSAVEFALLAPLMLTMYVGASEINRKITIDRRVESVASTAADLTAQVKSVTTGDLQNICDASKVIIDPSDRLYGGSPPKIVLSSVVADQNNSGKVAWSYSDSAHCGGGSPRATNSAYALPAGTTVANSSVIVAEVTFAYTTKLKITKYFTNDDENLQRTIYARPRRSLTVAKIP
jgi:Flp pilus assembly protein TadG